MAASRPSGLLSRDDRLGINCLIVSYAATGIPVVLKFEHEQHVTVMDTFNDIMRDLFGVKEGSTNPISPVRRRYLGVAVDIFCESNLCGGWRPAGTS